MCSSRNGFRMPNQWSQREAVVIPCERRQPIKARQRAAKWSLHKRSMLEVLLRILEKNHRPRVNHYRMSTRIRGPGMAGTTAPTCAVPASWAESSLVVIRSMSRACMQAVNIMRPVSVASGLADRDPDQEDTLSLAGDLPAMWSLSRPDGVLSASYNEVPSEYCDCLERSSPLICPSVQDVDSEQGIAYRPDGRKGKLFKFLRHPKYPKYPNNPSSRPLLNNALNRC